MLILSMSKGLYISKLGKKNLIRKIELYFCLISGFTLYSGTQSNCQGRKVSYFESI
jgi:hypothetical protein